MLHPTTYEYLKPTDQQMRLMNMARKAARAYSDALEALIPDGPDKTYVLRRVRETAMWVNVAITRHADGAPRHETDEPHKELLKGTRYDPALDKEHKRGQILPDRIENYRPEDPLPDPNEPIFHHRV